MAENLVKFVATSAVAYAAATNLDENTLYFVTDERRIYKGSTPYSGGIYKEVDAVPSSPVVNVLYYIKPTGQVVFYNGTALVTLVAPYSTALSASSTNAELATAKSVVDYVSSTVSDLDISKITAQVNTNKTNISSLQDEIEKKADSATTLAGYGIDDAYTKAQVDTAISSAVANAHHLKREIVASLPSVSSANEDTIYMVPDSGSTDASGSATSSYVEYMLINGGFERIGTSDVDLSNYVTKEDLSAAKTEAINSAAADATTKANSALSSANSYADSLAKNYATAAQGTKADSALQAGDITESSSAGKITVKGADVAIHGLGSAAYTNSNAYATAAQGEKADSVYSAITWGTL